MLASRYFLGTGIGQMPGLLLNPVFLLLLLGALVTPEILLETISRHADISTPRRKNDGRRHGRAGKIANRSGSAAIYNKV